MVPIYSLRCRTARIFSMNCMTIGRAADQPEIGRLSISNKTTQQKLLLALVGELDCTAHYIQIE